VDCTATPQTPADEGFEPWELATAEHVVAGFLATHPAPRDIEAEDLLQECLLHWWQQRRLYDPQRGASLPTFMRRVLQAKLIDIARGESAEKRQAFAGAVSLDEPLNRDDDEGGGADLTLNDILPDKSADWQTEDAADQALLKECIDRVVDLLSPRQQQLLEMLRADAAIARISSTLGIPRATLYDELARIKAIFRDEGLEQFLE
jgi:RNA polymerase sigma factor (sigma-70 family)